jgi:hypothetical protein
MIQTQGISPIFLSKHSNRLKEDLEEDETKVIAACVGHHDSGMCRTARAASRGRPRDPDPSTVFLPAPVRPLDAG